MRDHQVTLRFTNRHAYTPLARWSDDPATLAQTLDWTILQNGDFSRDDAYPDKKGRYQAEALAHGHVPPSAVIGIGCVSAGVESKVKLIVDAAGLPLPVRVRPVWFFS
jgi:hypothetical protein